MGDCKAVTHGSATTAIGASASDRTAEFQALWTQLSAQSSRTHTPRARTRDERDQIVATHFAHARKARQAISQLRFFVLQNARDYVGATRHTRQSPNDSVLDAIENEANRLKGQCEAKLRPLQKAVPDHAQVGNWGWNVPEPELPAVVAGTVASLADYHDKTSLFFEALTKARERRALRCHRLSRPAPIKAALMRGANKPATPAENAAERHEIGHSASASPGSDTPTGDGTAPQHTHMNFTTVLDHSDDVDAVMQDEIKQENTVLFKEMTTLTQEVDLTTQKASEILSLSAKFSALLAGQDAQIEGLGQDVIDAKLNVTKGNAEIQEATKSGNDLRWMIVFILVVCSASLLYLDWRSQGASVPSPPPPSEHQEL